MKPTEQDYFERRFLNNGKYHSVAAISVSAEVDEKELRDGDWGAFTADFTISDCSRSINLSIDLESEEDLNNSIHKMRQIEEVTKGFREYMEGLRDKVKEYEVIRENKTEI